MPFPINFLWEIIPNIIIYLLIRAFLILISIFWYLLVFVLLLSYPTAVFLYNRYLQHQIDQLLNASRAIQRRNDRTLEMSHRVQDQIDEAFRQIERYERMYINRNLNNNATQVHHLNRIREEVDYHRIWLTDFRNRWERQVVRAIRNFRLRLAEHLQELYHSRQVIGHPEFVGEMHEVVLPNLDWMRDYPNPTIELGFFVREWTERNLLRELSILFRDLFY